MTNKFSITHEGEGLEHVAILRDEEHGSEVRVAVGYGFNAYSFKVQTGKRRRRRPLRRGGLSRADLAPRPTAHRSSFPSPTASRAASSPTTARPTPFPATTTASTPSTDSPSISRGGSSKNETDDGWASITGEFEMLRDSQFTEEHWPGNFRVRCEVMLARQLSRSTVLRQESLQRADSVRTRNAPVFSIAGDESGTLTMRNHRRCGDTRRARQDDSNWQVRPVDDETRLMIVTRIDGLNGRVPIHIGSRRLDDVYTGLQPFGFDRSAPSFAHASSTYERSYSRSRRFPTTPTFPMWSSTFRRIVRRFASNHTPA